MGAGAGFRSLASWFLVVFLALGVVCFARQTAATLPAGGTKNDGRRLRAEERELTSGMVRMDAADYSDPRTHPPPPTLKRRRAHYHILSGTARMDDHHGTFPTPKSMKPPSPSPPPHPRS